MTEQEKQTYYSIYRAGFWAFITVVLLNITLFALGVDLHADKAIYIGSIVYITAVLLSRSS